MHQIAENLWVGAQADWEHMQITNPNHGWAVVFAAKEPFHRDALGYKGRAVEKDHPEYLIARRGHNLILNLIDADDPKYIPKEIIDAAVAHIRRTALIDDHNAMIVCNQGGSRAPTIGLLCVAQGLPDDFEDAEAEYRKVCPSYAPARGMREFARANWSHYQGHTPKAPTDSLDKAEEIWQRFCSDLASDPAQAKANLIASIRQALQGAPAT